MSRIAFDIYLKESLMFAAEKSQDPRDANIICMREQVEQNLKFVTRRNAYVR